jgi:hypothetical protein
MAKPNVIKQEKEITVIEIGKKVLHLEIRDFGSSDIDIEDLLQVDLNNILMDIITYPVIFNRIANIKAEIDAILREVKLDMSIFEAQLFQQHKKKLIGAGEKATEAAIDSAVKQDPQYKIKKKAEIDAQKDADIVDGLYWSAKSKDQKLNAISAKLKPEEFETDILEGTINSVLIRAYNNNFRPHR